MYRQTEADRGRHRYRQDIDKVRQKERQTYIQNIQTDQTDRQADRQAVKHVGIHRQAWLLYGLQGGEKMMDLSQTIYIGYYERQQVL